MHRRLPGIVLLLSLVVAVASCERSRAPATARTPATSRPESLGPSPVAASPASLWDSSAGPVLFARATSVFSAYVVFPAYTDSTIPDSLHLDSKPFDGDTVDLIGRSGVLATAPIGGGEAVTWPGEDCDQWPTVAIAPGADTGRVAGWSVAFLHGRVTSVSLDSIEGLAPTDSARLAADVTRLVAALPVERGGTFRGIPFLVRYAYTFPAAPRTRGMVADVVRTLNQEAAPLEEHTLIVAERDSADANGRYRVVYSERTSGAVDSLETSDVMAALRLGAPPHIALVLLRGGMEAEAYTLLERVAPARWRARWTSAHAGC